jgi:hypothetical protein
MFGAIRERLTYANVMATAAVFIALGGTAVALDNNQIESRHIDNGAVQTQDVKNDDLTGADINESTLDIFLETEAPSGGKPADWEGPNSAVAYCDKGWDVTGGGGFVEFGGNGALSTSTWTNREVPSGGSPGWVVNSTGGASQVSLVCARLVGDG